ncbi:DoxX family protein [Bradyrhizobium sp.]|uniref:DoxX family protein n=1 Tax=Bradyrhizobium sp. TaxID=376 RepID=UPI00262B6194|nr:DoxX family protein [Bradyrhizobium sp.]
MSGRGKWTGIVYWVTTVLTALLFAAPGLALVLRDPHFVAEMTRLGYPGYFLPFLGIWKILGAIVVLVPGARYLKEWAYAGMIFDIAGAVVSRAAAGDHGLEFVLPFIIACIVALSWGLRPDVRRLSRVATQSKIVQGAQLARPSP